MKNAAAAAAMVLGLGGAFNVVDKFEWTGKELTSYLDPLGIRTICRGHTGYLAQRGYATREECDKITLEDLQRFKKVVESCVHVPLSNGELNAWVSFAYNVGPGKKGVKDGMCMLKNGRVPTHVRLLNEGKHRAACEMLLQWTMPGTVVYNGLLRRRTDELALCVRDL